MSYDWDSKLVKLRMLKPGWDGYDAPTPTLEALEVAQYFLNAEYPGKEFLTRLSASVIGGVVMTFRNTELDKHRTVYLEIYDRGSAAAMRLNDGKIETCAVEDDFDGREKFYYQAQSFLNGGQIESDVQP